MSLHAEPLYLSQQIRALEQHETGGNLMHKAGLAIATLAEELLGDSADPVLIIAGPGNNGGDALVAALQLKNRWHRVIVVLTGDPHKLPADAANAYQDWIAAGGSLHTAIPSDTHFSLIIDGLFGIGLKRPLQNDHAELVRQINALPYPVLAIDVPSGINADSGQVLGCAVEADHTLTLLGLKPGLYTLDGPDHAGLVHFSDLGVTNNGDEPARGWLLQQDILATLPRRKLNSHKGLFGAVAILGGSAGMSGAVLLAARAALLCGSGRVYGGFLAASTPAVDMQHPEIMLRTAQSIAELPRLSCAAIGPGLGQTSAAACDLMEHWLTQDVPLLLDADALNLLATHAHLRETMQQRQAASIMTPHPLEAARLLNCASADVQKNRIGSALKLAQIFKAVCILKGVGSICATPDGDWYINTSGNPGLASAGSGDVLSGIIASLLGQGLSAIDAAKLGVYLHGAAADALVRQGIGPIGLTASELIPAVRNLINNQ